MGPDEVATTPGRGNLEGCTVDRRANADPDRRPGLCSQTHIQKSLLIKRSFPYMIHHIVSLQRSMRAQKAMRAEH
jgi:hypothetical protein